MAETLAPAVFVTDEIRLQATREGIEGFAPNLPDLAKLAEISDSTVAADALVVTIGRARPKLPGRKRSTVFFGGDLAQQVDIQEVTKDRDVLRLYIPNRPITESNLSRLACSNLLTPARNRDFNRLFLPGASELAVGVLSMMGAVASAFVEEEPYPITSLLTAVSGITLAAGIVTKRMYKTRELERSMIEHGGARLLSPIVVRRAAKKP